MNVTEGEYCETVREEYHKAKKRHICGECRELILPGDKYFAIGYAQNGKINNHKICCDCESVAKTFFGGAWTYCCLWEDLWDNFVEDGVGSYKRLIENVTPKAKDRILSIIKDIKAKE